MPKKKRLVPEENESESRQEGIEEQGERLAAKPPLSFMVDSLMRIQKQRVAAQVRSSHLARRNELDPDTDFIRDEIARAEKAILGRLKRLIKKHPSYSWAIRIKGVGPENLAKVVGLIDISRAPHLSSLWKYAGFHVVDGKAPKPVPGQKLDFNRELRTMCRRLGDSIVKNGTRFGGCKLHDIFKAELERLTEKFNNEGRKVVPVAELPNKGGKRYESEEYISLGHVRAMAMRKMIKIFLGCLWLVWREAEGLPTSQPYAIEKLGHSHLIEPEMIVDKPKRFPRKAKALRKAA